MKLSTKSLKSALVELGRLIKPKQFVPQLVYIQINRHSDSTVCLRACDGESWATRILESEGIAEGCIAHRRFLALLENTKCEETEISIKDNWAVIRTHAVSRLPALEAKVFPDFPVQEKVRALGISTLDMAEGIDSVAWAAEDNELLSTRLLNVFVESEPKQLSVYAGSKYSIARFRRGLIGEAVSFGIPGSYARLISAVLRESESKLVLGERFLMAESRNGSAFVKLTTEKPARYDDAIGLHQAPPVVAMDRNLIKQACNHAMALTDDANYPALEICWEGGLVTFNSGDKEGTGYEYSISIGPGEGWCKLNAKHLHEAMRLMPEGPLTVTTAPNGSFWMVGDVLVALGQLGMRKV